VGTRILYRLSARSLLAALAIAALAAALAGTCAAVGLLDFPEVRLLDWRFRCRGSLPPPPEIAIVGLDDAWMKGAGRFSPLPRDRLARVIRQVAAHGAKTIVLDVELPDRRPPAEAAEDEALRQALADAAGPAQVIIVATLDRSGRPVPPHQDFFDAASGSGVAHVEETVADHRARWFRLFYDGQPCLALAAVAPFTGRDPSSWGSPRGDERRLIDFVGPPGAIPVVSPGAGLRGKLVFIGSTWSGSRDRFLGPPFSGWLEDPRAHQYTGVELQADCAASLLAKPPLREQPFAGAVAATLIAALVAALAMVHLHPAPGLVILLAGEAAWLWWGQRVFIADGLALRLAPPLLAVAAAYPAALLARNLFLDAEARRIAQHFRRYVGPQVLETLQRRRASELGLQGAERTVTLLFADIRDYTAWIRHRAPGEVVGLLNRYFAAVCEPLLVHNGYLDKFIGDGLMVVFDAFSTSGDHGAQDAFQAAVSMRERVASLAAEPDFAGLAVGIGIHTGRVVVGDMGIPGRRDFTAVGPAVNLAARIEGETRRLFQERAAARPSAAILMSDATRQILGDRVEAQDLGEREIRGAGMVRLWEVGSERGK
jgi:adenylate cyclase